MRRPHVTAPDVGKRFMRPGEADYNEDKARSDQWVADHGVRLSDPTPALLTEYANRGIEACAAAAARSGRPFSVYNYYGDNFAEQFTDGEIVTALIGDYFGVTYIPNRGGKPDEGGDLHLRPDYHLDVKSRQLFLTTDHDQWNKITHKPAIRYLVLVQHGPAKDSPYVYCGGITPQRFHALQRALPRRRELMMRGLLHHWVAPHELIAPADFDPIVRAVLESHP